MLREGLANYVHDEYPMVEGVRAGSTEEMLKKKRRKALATRERRIAPAEVVPSVAGLSSKGRGDDIVILSLEPESPTRVQMETVPAV